MLAGNVLNLLVSRDSLTELYIVMAGPELTSATAFGQVQERKSNCIFYQRETKI